MKIALMVVGGIILLIIIGIVFKIKSDYEVTLRKNLLNDYMNDEAVKNGSGETIGDYVERVNYLETEVVHGEDLIGGYTNDEAVKNGSGEKLGDYMKRVKKTEN